MKLFKLIVLLLFPILSFSQELFTQTEIVINEGLKTKQGKYLKMSDYVIRYSDATPEELYDKTDDYCLSNPKSKATVFILFLYSCEPPFYAALNEACRTRDQKLIHMFGPFASALF